MTTIVFDVAAFRLQFPKFANVVTYPNATLQGYFNSATDFISADYTRCLSLTGPARVNALNLLTAHLAFLFDKISAGEQFAYVQGATIDKVSVTLTPPPNKTQFQWWLNLSPYGSQLLALLMVKGVGGFMAGGLPERSAFRKVGGIF